MNTNNSNNPNTTEELKNLIQLLKTADFKSILTYLMLLSSIKPYNYEYKDLKGSVINPDYINNFKTFLCGALAFYILDENGEAPHITTPFLGCAYATSLLIPPEKLLEMLQDEKTFFEYINKMGNDMTTSFLSDFEPSIYSNLNFNLEKRTISILEKTIYLSTEDFSTQKGIDSFNYILQCYRYLRFATNGIPELTDRLDYIQNQLANSLLANLHLSNNVTIKDFFKVLLASHLIDEVQDLAKISEVLPIVDENNHTQYYIVTKDKKRTVINIQGITEPVLTAILEAKKKLETVKRFFAKETGSIPSKRIFPFLGHTFEIQDNIFPELTLLKTNPDIEI